MAGDVIFTQFTMAGTTDQVFNPELVDIVNESTVSALEQDAEKVVNEMGFYQEKAINPDQKISVKLGARELSELTEGQVLPLIDWGKGSDKGMQVKMYGGMKSTTKLAHDWANSTQTLAGADASVKQAIGQFVEGIKDLKSGASMDKAIEATALLTSGFANTASNWPWSLTPWGQFLFDTDHAYTGGWGGTFRNVLGGSYGTLNDALTADQAGIDAMQDMIDILKTETKTQRGHKIIKPDYYTLIVPTELEVVAGKNLNSAGTSAGMYAGTGSNAELVNQFYFNGNKVRYISNPYIGYATNEKGTLGATTNWFMVNTRGMKDQRGLRYIPLNEGELETFYDPKTKDYFVSYYHACAIDHFGAESYIVGSQGTA